MPFSGGQTRAGEKYVPATGTRAEVYVKFVPFLICTRENSGIHNSGGMLASLNKRHLEHGHKWEESRSFGRLMASTDNTKERDRDAMGGNPRRSLRFRTSAWFSFFGAGGAHRDGGQHRAAGRTSIRANRRRLLPLPPDYVDAIGGLCFEVECPGRGVVGGPYPSLRSNRRPGITIDLARKEGGPENIGRHIKMVPTSFPFNAPTIIQAIRAETNRRLRIAGGARGQGNPFPCEDVGWPSPSGRYGQASSDGVMIHGRPSCTITAEASRKAPTPDRAFRPWRWSILHLRKHHASRSAVQICRRLGCTRGLGFSPPPPPPPFIGIVQAMAHQHEVAFRYRYVRTHAKDAKQK